MRTNMTASDGKARYVHSYTPAISRFLHSSVRATAVIDFRRKIFQL